MMAGDMSEAKRKMMKGGGMPARSKFDYHPNDFKLGEGLHAGQAFVNQPQALNDVVGAGGVQAMNQGQEEYIRQKLTPRLGTGGVQPMSAGQQEYVRQKLNPQLAAGPSPGPKAEVSSGSPGGFRPMTENEGDYIQNRLRPRLNALGEQLKARGGPAVTRRVARRLSRGRPSAPPERSGGGGGGGIGTSSQLEGATRNPFYAE